MAQKNPCSIRNVNIFEIILYELANQSYDVFCADMQIDVN